MLRYVVTYFSLQHLENRKTMLQELENPNDSKDPQEFRTFTHLKEYRQLYRSVEFLELEKSLNL